MKHACSFLKHTAAAFPLLLCLVMCGGCITRFAEADTLEASVEVLTDPVEDGHDFVFLIKASRSFVVMEYSLHMNDAAATPDFAKCTARISTSSTETVSFTAGGTYSPGISGECRVTVPEVPVGGDHGGILHLVLRSAGSEITLSFDVPYTALSHRTVEPGGISLYGTDGFPFGGVLRMDYDTRTKLRAVFDNPLGEGGVTVRSSRGKVRFIRGASGEPAERLTVDALSFATDPTFTVVCGDPSVWGEDEVVVASEMGSAAAVLPVYVRRRVGLKVWGEVNSKSKNESYGYWNGILEDMQFRMVTWQGDLPDEAKDLVEISGTDTFDLTMRVSGSTTFCGHFWCAGYNTCEVENGDLQGDRVAGLQNEDNDFRFTGLSVGETFKVTLGKGLPWIRRFLEANRSKFTRDLDYINFQTKWINNYKTYLKEKTFAAFIAYARSEGFVVPDDIGDMNIVTFIDYYDDDYWRWYTNMFGTHFSARNKSGWPSFSVYPASISIDTDRYDIRYVFNMWTAKVGGDNYCGGTHWWSSADRTPGTLPDRTWIQVWKK